MQDPAILNNTVFLTEDMKRRQLQDAGAGRPEEEGKGCDGVLAHGQHFVFHTHGSCLQGFERDHLHAYT